MTDRILEAVTETLRDSRKTTILVLLIIVLSPVGLNVYLLAERSGYVTNASQAEHQEIRKTQAKLELEMAALTLSANTIAQGVVMTNAVQNDLAYFLQLICVQQAKTAHDRDKGCLAPAWRRTLEVKQP